MTSRAQAMIAFVFALAMLGGGAQAQDKNGCDQFKWSVARERAWFAAERQPIASGATVVAGQGYAVTLAPNESVAFRAPPERALKAGGFGATLSLANIDKAGSYEITLSDEGRIDAVQGDALIKSTDYSGQKDCPGIRKSVRFDLKTGPLTVQISNAPTASIDLAIAPAQ
jgi:hypothetical protein